MTDVPPDVDSVLTQLFHEGRKAFEQGEVATGVSAVTSAGTVAQHKLPESPLRERLLHGCERAETVAISADDDSTVAAEYVAAMERCLADETTE